MRRNIVLAAVALFAATARAASAQPFDIQCVYTSPDEPIDVFEVDRQAPSIKEVIQRSMFLTSETRQGNTLEWNSVRTEKRGTARLRYSLDLDTLKLTASGIVIVDREGDRGPESKEAICTRVPTPATKP